MATNITRIHAVPGSHHPQWLDALRRAPPAWRARVPDEQGDGPAEPAPQAWTSTKAGSSPANIAADLTAWTRLLGLHDRPDLAHANPAPCATGCCTYPRNRHPRPPRTLSIPDTWPWADAFLLAGNASSLPPLKLTPHPGTYQQKDRPGPGDPARPQRHPAPPPHHEGTKRSSRNGQAGSITL